MRAVLVVLALATSAGCAELGVVTDGSSISYGKPSRGYLIDGVKLPDSGNGFTTREMWSKRGNRYGTDELVVLIKNVSKRMKKKVKDVRLVVADLSGDGGGAATTFHRSHQNGRDVDLLYYLRDAEGKPLEPQAMIPVDRSLVATDKSGVTIDVPRTWLLVKELLTAEEAYVQYIFMYQPLAQKLFEYAESKKEDPALIARAMRACKQPGDSAPHNDHMHVRIYCPETDRQFGCVDIGPLELLAERTAERDKKLQQIADALPRADAEEELPEISAAAVWAAATPTAFDAEPTAHAAAAANAATTAGTLSSSAASTSGAFSTLLRGRPDRIDLRLGR